MENYQISKSLLSSAVAAGTGGADGQCPPKTNCKIRITINIKIVIQGVPKKKDESIAPLFIGGF
jgi:hypothetical protein